ncbi:MAG: RNA polymerase sigma factor [Acidimicrobiales bacterium]
MAAGSPSSFDDLADVLAARRGDQEALARLVSSHTRLVRSVVLDHVRTPEDVADCVQETLARTVRGLARLDDPARFRPWLASIARHVAIDHRRRRVRELAVVHPTGVPVEDVHCRRPSPETIVARSQLSESVRATVDTLGARDAEAVTRTAYADQSPTELADALGVSVGNAKVITHRARRRLRDAMIRQVYAQDQLACDQLDRLEGADADAHLIACPRCRREALRVLRPDG